MVHDLGEWEIGRVDIVVTLDHLEVWGYLAKEIIGLAVSQVAQTKGLADFAGSQEFAELKSTLSAGWNELRRRRKTDLGWKILDDVLAEIVKLS